MTDLLKILLKRIGGESSLKKVVIGVIIFLILIIAALGLYFREYVQFGFYYIFHTPLKNVETYFNLCDLEQSALLDFHVKSFGLSGFVIETTLEIREEQFDYMFYQYQSEKRDKEYPNTVMFSDSGISADELDFYIWSPSSVSMANIKSQRNIYIIKSRSKDGVCKIFMSIDKIGWIKN